MFLSFSVFVFFFLIIRDGNFFDEKDLKTATRRFNRASSAKVSAFQRKKTTDDDGKICRFLSTFFF